MLITIGQRLTFLCATIFVVGISIRLWPVDQIYADRELAAAGAKLCYALDETLLVGARLEGPQFGDDQVITAARVPSLQRLSLARSSVTEQGILSLQPLSRLTSLNLSGTRLSPDSLDTVSRLSWLRELQFDECDWLRDDHLLKLVPLQKLEYLSLSQTSVSAAGLENLKQLPSLKFLVLDRCSRIDDSSFTTLVSLCGQQKICLSLSGTEVTLECLGQIRQAAPGGRIHFRPDSIIGLREISSRGQFLVNPRGIITGFRRKTDTDGVPISLQRGDLSLVGGFQEITELNLDQTNVDDAMLLELQYLPYLESLRLTGTHVTDEGLRVLAGFPNLKSLSLMQNDIEGTGLANLGYLLNLTNLKVQSLRGDVIMSYLGSLPELEMLTINAPLTQRGITMLARLPRLKVLAFVGMDLHGREIAELSASSTLTELRFDGGSVDDSDIEAIAGLKSISAVMLIQTKVTSAGRDRLVALRPGLSVQWPRDPALPAR